MGNERKNRLVVLLDDYENSCLVRKADISGLNKSDYVRELIRGYCPTEAPGKEFFEAYDRMKDMAAEINRTAVEAIMRGCFQIEDIDSIRLTAFRMEYLLKEIRNIVMSARPIDEPMDDETG